jgi:flagellar hook-associated protein 2
MGSIISGGVGSGLDVQGLVQKLVEAEGAPKSVRLDKEEATAQGKLSALGTLRSALATFRDSVAALKSLDKFQGRQVTLSSKDFISGTALSTAAPGSYSIEVQDLALAHKLYKDFAASSTVVGTGTLHVEAGGVAADITIDSTNNTVAGIAEAINQSAAGEKVVAGVVTGAGGAARLTISSRATGAANALTITQSGGDGGLVGIVSPPAVGGLSQAQPAQDASVLIDGFAVTSATNTISGAIAGVDVTVLAENEADETTELTVGYNRDAARKSVDELVKSYNALVEAVQKLASFNAETRQGGPLFGDAGVRNIVYQLRRELTSTLSGLSGPFDTLGELGISAELDGKLAVNATKLDAAFAEDFDAVGEVFATTDVGLAAKLDKLLEPYLQAGGVFDSRTATLKSSIEDIGDRREALNQRLEALHARYLKQFNALDGLLAQLSSTSNFLTQQLARLPGNALLDND